MYLHMGVVDRIKPFPPKDICVLISGTCEYVTLYNKRDFSDVVKNLNSPGRPEVITMVPIKR